MASRPMFGDYSTVPAHCGKDGFALPQPSDALYHDRDGRVYEAVFEREYERGVDFVDPQTQKGLSKKIRCADLRVNFQPNPLAAENWLPAYAVYCADNVPRGLGPAKAWWERMPVAPSPTPSASPAPVAESKKSEPPQPQPKSEGPTKKPK